MNYDLEHIKELTGTLMTLDESAVIPEVFMELDSSTARKLAAVFRNGRPTKENQRLFFVSISIPKNCVETFIKGQTSMVKDGNRYIMTTVPRTPSRFKGFMQALVKGSDGYDYACEIEIGNMDFDIGDKTPSITEDVAIFENIPAMVYPYGNYRAVILQDEN